MLRQVSQSTLTSCRGLLMPGLAGATRAWASDSHDDFKAQSTAGPSQSADDMIKEDILKNKVMVYMKGFPDQPMCGFSGRVVALMNAYDVKFNSRNVLDDPDLREGVKKFSNWPTIPQVFVDGEFVGGCDILWEAHEGGEFEQLMGKSADAAAASK